MIEDIKNILILEWSKLGKLIFWWWTSIPLQLNDILTQCIFFFPGKQNQENKDQESKKGDFTSLFKLG